MTASPDPTCDGPPRARITLGVVHDQPAEVISAADFAAHFDPEAPTTSSTPGASPTAEPQTGEGEQ